MFFKVSFYTPVYIWVIIFILGKGKDALEPKVQVAGAYPSFL